MKDTAGAVRLRNIILDDKMTSLCHSGISDSPLKCDPVAHCVLIEDEIFVLDHNYWKIWNEYYEM